MAGRAPRASAVATRERLLASGLQLFHARGYHAVGVQDIIDAAGIPKGSFYNHFRSKQDLALAALEQYATLSPLDELRSHPGGPRAGLRAHFEELRRRFAEADLTQGCMMGNFANELADQDEPVRELLNCLFSAWIALIAAALREAEADEGIHLTVPADALAGVIVSLWEGSITRARAANSIEPVDQFFDTVFSQLLATATNQKDA